MMGNVRGIGRNVLILFVMILLAGVLGCQQNRQYDQNAPDVENPALLEEPGLMETTDPLGRAEEADLARNAEVQLVEQMGRYRANYMETLELMLDFYNRQGNQLKSRWVKEEIKNLNLGPRYSYLVVAEVAGPDLRASKMVMEADVLYDQGMAMMKSGRGSLGKIGVDKKAMYSAIDKFNQLITLYPDSDKIDDAAFQIAEIYNHYLSEKTTAMLYYQRVWQWDPQSLLPARFAVARIYDDYFHNRTKAIEYYEKSINLESSYTKNVTYAQNRIEILNRELSR